LKLRITVDGKVYEVDVEVAEADHPPTGYYPPVPAHSRVPASTPPPAAAPPPPEVSSAGGRAESKLCRTPFAGTVVRVVAQVGHAIEPDDVLMVLEAMKMETMIVAAVAGKVARVNAKAGDVVQGGQVVVEFE
jgi:methylmalonyl-CoA carboxyltransferase small subunit